MEYIEVKLATKDENLRERIIAQLDDDNITGFEETEEALLIYFKQGGSTASVAEFANNNNVAITINTIAERNWNESWESNFEPVVIDDFCYIRADFHPERKDIAHEILITPKMSFGTGHHATTLQMVQLMRNLDFQQKDVFDFGTGTGILAILAHRLGAQRIVAIDNDEWAYANAMENCVRNNATHIEVAQTTIETLPTTAAFDIILANINRHILLDTMPAMSAHLKPGGTLLLSGILANEDVDIIREAAQTNELKELRLTTHDKWAAMHFFK
jgi:ribosomal protein L11 methyltransferase